jgi:hypothetical protein
MSDMFCIFQKLWNSFDLNESGHVSLSETQRVSSEFRIQTSELRFHSPDSDPESRKVRIPEARVYRAVQQRRIINFTVKNYILKGL